MTKISKIPFTSTKFTRRSLDKSSEPVYQQLMIPGVPEVLIYENGEILTRLQSKKIPRQDCEIVLELACTIREFVFEHTEFNNLFVNQSELPYLICFCDGYFTNLDNIIYETPVRDYLNKVGLHIYFWELPVLSTNNAEFDQWPLILKNNESIEELFLKYKNTIFGFESTSENLSNLTCLDFNSITRFVRNNNLTNVTVCTGNYQNHKYFSKKYPDLQFKVRDLYTASVFCPSTQTQLKSYTYNPNLTPPTAETIEYKFWSGNRRYSPQRHVVAAYLVYRSSLISFDYYNIHFIQEYNKIPENLKFWNNINNKLWFDLNNWKTKYTSIYNNLNQGLDYIDSVKFLEIDITTNIKNYEPDDIWKVDLPLEYYQSCFCAIVTETEFAQPCGHYAEKTLNAIKCFRPFVLVAPPRTLEYLKLCGVKTFDQWWDESYDQEENHELRLIKILELIDYIDSIPLDELREIYTEMLPILEHNYKVIQNLKYQDNINA